MEILSNLLLGADETVEPLPPPAPGGFPTALEAVLLKALARPPCVVSFSGGRDSSAILAASVDAARRHGLALPVPVTMRFPHAPASDETTWQQLVLDHLGLARGDVVELDDEVEALGPLARESLRANGLIWPGNAHMHLPVLERARGGTLLTGVGGDELLGSSSPRRPWRTAVRHALPRRVRRAGRMRRLRHAPDEWGWLTAQGRRTVLRALAEEELAWPYPWDEALRYWHASRAYGALDGSIGRVGRLRDVHVVNPLLAPGVLSALAAMGGARGFPDRTTAMRRLFGHLLPEAVLSRPRKAVFTAPAFRHATRAFVAAWDGSGVEHEMVDVARLRAEVLGDEPDFRVILLVQQAWLQSQASASSS